MVYYLLTSVPSVVFFLSVFSPSGKGMLCGHADGSIVRYLFEEEGPEFTKVCPTVCVIDLFDKNSCTINQFCIPNGLQLWKLIRFSYI